ncbi:hypothetical protein [Streptomyces sp. NBC_00122]|uniref:hypothetical protein n=1 Tax=Streptomyces sp. NBC_00122 TaxID=2903623 RepID=UPI00324E3FF4
MHDTADTAGIPEGLLPPIAACLAKAPGDRPTAAELRDVLAEDTPGPWLPGGLLQLIAERSAQMLQLPDIEPTRTTVPSAPTGPEATADAPQAPAVVPVSLPARPRRRSLLAAGGALALLAGGGGTAAWLLRDKEKESTPDKKGPGPVRPILAIGLQADLSGPGQAVGKAQRDGALLAVEELTSRDDLPFAFRLAESDDRGAAPPARPASPLPWPATGAGPSPPRPSTTSASSRKRARAPRAGCWSPPRSTRPRPPRPAPSTRPSAPVIGPPPYAAEAYDAVHLLARCAQGLGRAQVGRGDLVPTLRGTRYEGVSKAYAFEQANGTYTGDGLFFYEVASGRFRFLGNRSTAWPV